MPNHLKKIVNGSWIKKKKVFFVVSDCSNT